MVATTLAAGDVALLGYNTEDGGTDADLLAFVLMKPVGSGTTIYFTDRAWNGTAFAAPGAGEATYPFTTGADLAAGTIITITAAQLSSFGINLSDLGETIYVYQGTADAPTGFLYALEVADGNAVFAGTLTGTGLSVAANTATALAADNGVFAARTNNIQLPLLLDSINDPNDWAQSDTAPFAGPTNGTNAFTAPDQQIWIAAGTTVGGGAIFRVDQDATLGQGALGYAINSIYENQPETGTGSTSTSFFGPKDIVLDTVNDRFFIADSNGTQDRILQGSISAALANPGTAPAFTILYTQAADGGTLGITGIALDATNSLVYFTESNLLRKVTYDTAGQAAVTLADLGTDTETGNPNFANELAFDPATGRAFIVSTQVSSEITDIDGNGDPIFTNVATQNSIFRVDNIAAADTNASDNTITKLIFGTSGENASFVTGVPDPQELEDTLGSIKGIDINTATGDVWFTTVQLNTAGSGETGGIYRMAAADANGVGGTPVVVYSETDATNQNFQYITIDEATGRYYVTSQEPNNAHKIYRGALTGGGTVDDPIDFATIGNANGLTPYGLNVQNAPTLTGTTPAVAVLDVGTGETNRVNPFTSLTASDVDTLNTGDELRGAQVRITNNFLSGANQDFLRIAGSTSGTLTDPGIIFTYDTTTGVMTLTGVATVAEYASALQSVTFSSSNNADNSGAAPNRTIAASVFDGLLYSDELISTVAVSTNTPPVAVDDTLAATEDTVATFTAAQLTANDTDADGNPRTVTNVTAVTGGTVSLSGTTITFTPTANFNGPAAFDYTISDGQGGTDIGRVTVNVAAVNDAPVNSVGGTVVTTEDATGVALTGMSIADVDANPATSRLYVTFQVANGAIVLRTDVAGGIVDEDIIALAVDTVMVHATLNKINATLAASNGLTYSPNANLSGSDVLTVSTNDGGVTGSDPGLTGDAETEEDTDTRTILITGINDAPAGTDATYTFAEDGSRTLSVADFGFIDSADNNGFTGVLITTLPSDGVLRLNGVAITAAGTFVTEAQITAGQLVFAADANENGTPYGNFTFQVRDNGGTSGGGVDTDPTPNRLTFNVTATNDAPVLDLNGNAAGDGTNNGAYEQDPTGAGGIAPAATVTDIDSANFDTGTLTVAITAAAQPGDVLDVDDFSDGSGNFVTVSGNALSFNGTVVATYTAGDHDTPLVVTFDADATAVAVQFVTRAVNFLHTSDNPNQATRSLTYTLTDGDGGTDSAVATVGVTPDNDAPQSTAPTSAAIAFAENAATPTPLMQGVVLSDPDLPANFVGGSFTLNVSGGEGGINLKAGSLFSIVADGGGGFDLVFDNAGTPVAIGQIAGFGTTNMTVSALTGEATLARLNDLVDDFGYILVGDSPTAGDNTVTMTFNDGNNVGTIFSVAQATVETQTLTVTAANDAPTVSIMPGYGKSGGEFLVNTQTEGAQYVQSVAKLSTGGFVATFTDESNLGGDASGSGIKAQRFDAAGAKVGTEILVNTTTQFIQTQSTVAGFAAGGFVVAWYDDSGQSADDAGYAIRAQRFDANGGALGGELLVNTSLPGNQEQPRIATLASGGFVVTWSDPSGLNGDADSYSIKAQLFGSAGDRVGTELLVNTVTSGEQYDSSVTALGNGFIVTWSSGGDIKAQRFDAAGGKLGGEFFANTTTSGTQIESAVTALVGGGFVVTWRDESGQLGDGSVAGIVGQLFDAAAIPVGNEFLVNTITTRIQYQPEVAALSDGGFAITWTDDSRQSGDPAFGIKTQVFSASGTKIGSEFLVNTTTATDQAEPTIAALDGGAYVVLWSDFSGQGADPSGASVRGQIVAATAGFAATEQVTLDLKGAVAVADVDAGAGVLTATLAVPYGVLDITVGGSGATIVSGNATGSVVVSGTVAQLNALLGSDATSTVTYTADTDTPPASTTLTVTVNDGGNTGGTAQTGSDGEAITITAVDDLPVAVADVATVAENATTTVPVLTNDDDVDGGPKAVVSVDGTTLTANQSATIASGAVVTLNADGTLGYDPNGRFNYLVSPATVAATGAANGSAVDTFSYMLNGGSTTTVSVTVTGMDGPGSQLRGDAGANTITGTPQADFFELSQGGNDTPSGGSGNDAFYFGTTLTAADRVDGGAGADVVAVQGNYPALTLGAENLVNVETLSLLTGSDGRFGDTANNRYDYVVTSVDANVAAGQQLIVNGAALLTGEDLTFDGSAETDGTFLIYGGAGTDLLTGGGGADVFFMADGRFNAGDRMIGGGGADIVVLRGDFSVTLGATQLNGVETLTLMSAADTRFFVSGERYSYSVTSDDGNVAAGERLTVNGAGLQSDETMSFNGAAETDGVFSLFGGGGNDVLTGGAGADLIYGGRRGDTLTGGGGNDVFRYQDVAESNSTDRDGIQDFKLGDLIDLSRIDADINTAGDQAFSFVGSAAFSNRAGELRFENISLGGP
ncbi:MAG: tandem-95 repeat protein, partial [Sphingomonas bacterium]|uniref:Ig-like domain-containing protein n=1 Tax=Sphingomonas bacterium TaxID=1895847 RepID=UPI002631C7AA